MYTSPYLEGKKSKWSISKKSIKLQFVVRKAAKIFSFFSSLFLIRRITRVNVMRRTNNKNKIYADIIESNVHLKQNTWYEPPAMMCSILGLKEILVRGLLASRSKYTCTQPGVQIRCWPNSDQGICTSKKAKLYHFVLSISYIIKKAFLCSYFWCQTSSVDPSPNFTGSGLVSTDLGH